MTSIDDLIRHEPEGSTLDFKRAQYRAEGHGELLRDILAMANAHVPADQERRIIIGVDKKPDGTFTLHPISAAAFVDAAIYQELVNANIEPALDVDYYAHRFEGREDQVVGVIRIRRCDNRPYVMRKQKGKAMPGEAWIRRGTSKGLLSRNDLDRMYAARAEAAASDLRVKVTFAAPDDPTELTLHSIGPLRVKSQRVARKLERILEERERLRESGVPLAVDLLGNFRFSIPGQSIPLEQQSDDDLRAQLKDVRREYAEEDMYEALWKHAHAVNLAIYNDSDRHLDNVLIELSIPKRPGLLLADREYLNPMPKHPLISPSWMNLPAISREGPAYPEVSEMGDRYIATQRLRDVRHLMRTPAFREPLRITLSDRAIGDPIALTCTLRAANLRAPISTILRIRVVPKASSDPNVRD